mmetsp:Transcript_20425/g.29636  ORF Transcript_20425/g.29636 Transcript_20425/m.29636 type:complete len:80 (-) Transcript_20425:484-723(-)
MRIPKIGSRGLIMTRGYVVFSENSSDSEANGRADVLRTKVHLIAGVRVPYLRMVHAVVTAIPESWRLSVEDCSRVCKER